MPFCIFDVKSARNAPMCAGVHNPAFFICVPGSLTGCRRGFYDEFGERDQTIYAKSSRLAVCRAPPASILADIEYLCADRMIDKNQQPQ
jgi:hypothetical protein